MNLKKFRFVFFSILACVLCACTSQPYKGRQALEAVDGGRLNPSAAFVASHQLYIQYDYKGKSFYLQADLKDLEPSSRLPMLTLSAQEADGKKMLRRAEPVALAGTDWVVLLKDTLMSLLPQHPLEGKVVLIQNYETMLYRRPDGSADLVELNKAPADVKITGRVSSAQFRALLYERLKQAVIATHAPYTQYLLTLNGVPLSPFLYVDVEKDQIIQLKLPDYYQVEKEMTGLGFSVSFIYSFFVKSHLFGVIKAPFTSAHRLISMGTSTLYTALPPKIKDLPQVPPLASSGEEMDLKDFNAWLDRHISRQNYKANVTLLIDGEEFFPHFILAMQRAQESIFVRTYIFAADPYGLKIADMLRERSNDGVDVRVIVDELNTVLNSVKEPEFTPGDHFKMPKSIDDYIEKKSKASARTHLNTWSNFDHSKVYIVDRKIAYTGGMNIGEEYRYTWHDMMLALQGPVVGKLVKNFYETWSFTGWGGDYAAAYRKLFSKSSRDVNREEPGMINVRLMYTKPTDAEIFNAQREAIRRAKKRIFIQNAYFSDDRIVDELIQARGRGVDVRVILPGENDIGIMDANNRIKANQLWRNGVQVYFYNGMSHVKAALYDGWAVVGSANFDKMSLFINAEMSVGIDDPAFVAELEKRLFEKDFAHSKPMTQELDIGWASFLVDALTNQL